MGLPAPPPPTHAADPVALKGLAGLFQALGDPTRVRLLLLLRARGETSVTDLCAAVGMTQPAVSHHLNRLKRSGLVHYRTAGKFNRYRLTPAGLGPLAAALFPDPAAEPVVALGAVSVRLPRA